MISFISSPHHVSLLPMRLGLGVTCSCPRGCPCHSCGRKTPVGGVAAQYCGHGLSSSLILRRTPSVLSPWCCHNKVLEAGWLTAAEISAPAVPEELGKVLLAMLALNLLERTLSGLIQCLWLHTFVGLWLCLHLHGPPLFLVVALPWAR